MALRGRILLALLLMLGLACCGKKEQRGIRPGEIWPDEEGIHVNAHGGGILYHEGRYYWFGEAKSETTGAALIGVNCYSSEDLVNWKKEGVVLQVMEQKGHDLEKGCTLERPKVVYNAATGKFVIWFHLELKGRGYEAARAAVAVSDCVTGPYRFLRSGRVCPGRWPENLEEEYCHKERQVSPVASLISAS